MGTQTAATQTDSLSLVATATINASSGDFAPYFIGSMRQGRTVAANATTMSVGAFVPMASTGRYAWGAGVELIGGPSSAPDYLRWQPASAEFVPHRVDNPAVWVQQLYLQGRHRSVSLTAGMQQLYGDIIVNPLLSSGDLIYSGNARPIPQLRGELAFSDIPFTNRWVQINCVLSYGYMTDDNYLKDIYNRYNNHITSGSLYTYKRVYFRTRPTERVFVTLGAQVGAFFGGTATYYRNGKLSEVRKYSKSLKDWVNMIFPVFSKQEEFVEGSTIGSWDLRASLRLSRAMLSGYFEWPFEDGSGVAKRNGFDGLWGLELSIPGRRWLTGVVVEYIDFRNQSGPVHYAPDDFYNPTLDSQASGNDNYYNNNFYNAYANYGMSIGSPFLLSPRYNLDGFPAYAVNRANGCHLGVMGCIGDKGSYRLLFSYQRGLGTYNVPLPSVATDTSVMLETVWPLSSRLSLTGTVAYDSGSLRGDNFGAMVSMSYTLQPMSR